MSFGKEYFMKVYEEENNVEQAEESTPVVEEKVDKPVEVVTPVVEEKEETNEIVEKPTTFNIDGEEVTLDDIKEWKQGNMRQKDYTKKTQELANQRKELELKAKENPVIDEGEKTPELLRIEKLERELANEKLDSEITALKEKYPDFDEVKVLTECDKRGIYDDLEFVYKALRDAKPSEQLDIKTLKEQAIEEYKNSIAQELAKDKEATSGSIISSSPGTPQTDYSDMLTNDEKMFCQKRGWTYEEYAKMKDSKYKI